MASSSGKDKDVVEASVESPAIDIPVSDGDPSTSQVPESSPRPTSGSDDIAIVVPPVERPWEYQIYQDDTTIATIREEIVGQYDFKYLVQFQDGHEGIVSSGNDQ